MPAVFSSFNCQLTIDRPRAIAHDCQPDVENGITGRPVVVPPNQARGSCSGDSPLLTAKPRQHKDGPRVSGQKPDLTTRDEIERCHYKQRRRHLPDYQGSWLPCKALCETHRNKSSWIDCEEQAELAAINKDALRSLSIATMCIAEVPKTVSTVF